jgi:hypothetical protein
MEQTIQVKCDRSLPRGKVQVSPCIVLFTDLHQAKKRYPILEDYDADWVVADMLRIFLKNSCTVTRRGES